MNAYTDGELDTFGFLQPLIQISHGSEDTQTRAYCSLRIIFMRLGIPKVHEQSIPKELGNMSLIALDDFRTCRLISTNDFPVLFGVELRREFGGIDQVAEHDRELSSFRVRGAIFGGWFGLGRLVLLGCRLL